MCIKPTSYYKFLPLQLAYGQELNIFYLRIFGCVAYILIALLWCTKMDLQRRLGIYIGYDFSSIVKYIELMTRDVCTAYFVNCYFGELIFQTLGGEKEKQLVKKNMWNNLSCPDYHTK